MCKYIFNHFYHLRHDAFRSYILSPAIQNGQEEIQVISHLMNRIHPVYAMLFSFFSEPILLNDAIEKVSTFFDKPQDEIEETISLFIHNKKFKLEYKGHVHVFPPNILIEEEYAYMPIKKYKPEEFVYNQIDLKRERFFNVPYGIVFMINNICATDCVYCYADKKTKYDPIEFSRLQSIIKEAKKEGLMSFEIIGGEVFLYKHWEKLLHELNENSYTPLLISTKIPLSEDQIIQFKKFQIKLQISFDCIEEKTISEILEVRYGYAERMKNTITLLEKHEVNFQVATILTSHNGSINHLQKLYDFLKPFQFLSRWEIRVAFRSLYSRSDFNNFKLSNNGINEIDSWVEDLRTKSEMNILWSRETTDKYFKSDAGSRKFSGSRCSANFSHMVVMPDGKVTVCEQMYWNPRYIIGDISSQSLREVWNSERALKLAFPLRDHFSSKSACKTCNIYDECFAFPNKCFADVTKAYGDDNWDYPDPRCKKAPIFLNDMFHH